MKDKIEKYLKGQMNRKEEYRFYQLIKTNPVLRNDVVTRCLLIKSMQKIGKNKDYRIIQSILGEELI